MGHACDLQEGRCQGCPAGKGAGKSMWDASWQVILCPTHGRSGQNCCSDLLEKEMRQLTRSVCVLLFSPLSLFSDKTVFPSSLSTSLFSTPLSEVIEFICSIASLLRPRQYSVLGSPGILVGSSKPGSSQPGGQIVRSFLPLVRFPAHGLYSLMWIRAAGIPSFPVRPLPVQPSSTPSWLWQPVCLFPNIRKWFWLFSRRKMHFACIHIAA